MEFDKLLTKLACLEYDIKKLKVEFFDTEKFREFAHNLHTELDAFKEIYITGYSLRLYGMG